ncbi:hypothetical protein QR721_10745 [Aciduricibacillus chroicocephali]|uniref:Type 4 fimbrial biogenesis protein PilX N-terminal domain-containing protein n=1 Tax=Aciduricibacillus chroicocephali TaxID=3054939 RepID=A0ABY9KTG1_9BACI|nr:hypothetical protein QR721_10745 [Bacillaceae bacterium 44XB]
MKKGRAEDGYTLILVLLCATLFFMFAFLLVAMTTNGMKRDDVREDVTQATELSEKGLDRVVEEIQSDLKNVLGTEGLTASAFSGVLDSALSKYMCGSGKIITDTGQTGKYATCVEKVSPGTNSNGTSRIVTFLSNGTAGNTVRDLRSELEVGAAPIPESLKYAIGVNRDCGEPGGKTCSNGEGNLFMHGGVTIAGDMKVDGDLITTNYGYAYLGGEQWIPSLYPAAVQSENESSSRLVLGGEAYTFSPPPGSYSTHIQRSTFPSTTYRKATVSSAFSTSPLLIKRSPKRQEIDISGQKKVYQFGMSDSDVTLSSSTISGSQLSSKKAFAYGKTCNKSSCTEITNFTLSGANTFKQFATDRNVSLRNSSTTPQLTTTEKGMYVGGDLTIGNGSTSYDSSQYDKIDLSGPIFVNGNLTIRGADARLNALIYVNGSVTIQNTRINGLNTNGKAGSLIVFSNGEVKISNNSVNQDVPSNIRGYFYSKQNFEMYGVGSNIRIEGGISAKRIVLNAIRGRAKSSSFTNSYKISSTDYFEGLAEQQRRDSRLQVIYNPEIINTYSDLKQQEPVIYDVAEPVLKERRK